MKRHGRVGGEHVFPRTPLQALAQSNAALGGSGGAREQGGREEPGSREASVRLPMWNSGRKSPAKQHPPPRRPRNPIRGHTAAQRGWEGPGELPRATRSCPMAWMSSEVPTCPKAAKSLWDPLTKGTRTLLFWGHGSHRAWAALSLWYLTLLCPPTDVG